MENPIRQNLYEIGDTLRKLGENMCEQAQSKEDLDIQKMFNPHLLDLFKTILKIPSDLYEWRQQIEKEQKERAEPKVYPKGYVETDEELWAFWDAEDAYTAKFRKNRSDINDAHWVIYALIYENLFPQDTPNPTFTFTEALWKIEWQLRKLQDLFPMERCGTIAE